MVPVVVVVLRVRVLMGVVDEVEERVGAVMGVVVGVVPEVVLSWY